MGPLFGGGLCIMRTGWFAFLDGRSGLDAAVGSASALGAVGVVSHGWWGSMGVALRLVYFQLFGSCGSVVLRVVPLVGLAWFVFKFTVDLNPIFFP